MADVKIEKSEHTNEKPKVDLGLLEEDDEFEEFPADGNIPYYILKETDDGWQLSYSLSLLNILKCWILMYSTIILKYKCFLLNRLDW